MSQSTQNIEGYIVDFDNTYSDYGATKFEQRWRSGRIEKDQASVGIILACTFVPTLIFTVTFYVLSFGIRYWYSTAAYAIAAVMVLVCLGLAGMTLNALQGKGGDPRWLGLLCLLSFVAVIAGALLGNSNYNNNMQPFYELEQLNFYDSVDASTAEGNQYMDYGVIKFAEGTWIERMYTMAFKNENTYCVAPLKYKSNTPKAYDFWVTGTNCCSKHLFNFNCGMWNNAAARTGLRVMNEEDKSFYALAVQQAAAAYDIPVHHPVFLTWVQFGEDQVLGYQQQGTNAFETDVLIFFFIFLAATLGLAHVDKYF